MEEYKAYFIGPDGHIIHRIDLICESEDESGPDSSLTASPSSYGKWID